MKRRLRQATARRIRRAMTLLEIMVVIAILAVVLAVAIPSVNNVLAIQQVGATRELALTYRSLREEAILRNVTFRVAYNLDARTYKVELGDPNTLIFTNPEERAEYEDELADKMSRYTQREIEEGEAEDLREQRFEPLTGEIFEEVELPGETYIAWFYTPQYGEKVVPAVQFEDEERWEEEMEELEQPTIVYSYIFPNGFIEHTLIRIATVGDPDDGFTLEVEPLSGKVTVHDVELEPEDSLDWIPDEAPDLDL